MSDPIRLFCFPHAGAGEDRYDDQRERQDGDGRGGAQQPVGTTQIRVAVGHFARNLQQLITHRAKVGLRKALGDAIAERLDGADDLGLVELSVAIHPGAPPRLMRKNPSRTRPAT